MEVLLVDDQPTTVQVYAASVRQTFGGARVHIAVDLPEALQIAAGRAIDLVLLDLSLTSSRGVDTLQRFRHRFPDLPVLVVSASEDRAGIQACLDAGARGYIAKTAAIVGLPAAMRAIAAGGKYVPPQAH